METKRSTPETEAFIAQVHTQHKSSGLDDFEHYMDMTGQLAELARKLERERDSARELLREIRDNEVNPQDEADKFLRDGVCSELSKCREALSGRTVSCGQCNTIAADHASFVAMAESQLAKKDAQIKLLCQDWSDDDTRIKEIAKTHGIDVDSLSVEDGYFRTCVDVAEKMSEALTSKNAQIVALREALKFTSEYLPLWGFIAGDKEWQLKIIADEALSTTPPAVVPLEYVHSLIDGEPAQIVRNAKDGYPEGREDRALSIEERIAALKLFTADYQRWHKELEEVTGRKHP